MAQQQYRYVEARQSGDLWFPALVGGESVFDVDVATGMDAYIERLARAGWQYVDWEPWDQHGCQRRYRFKRAGA